MIVCNQEGCKASIQDDRWSKTRASDWFFMRDGRAYCPAHIPSWVQNYRARKAKGH